MQIPEYYVRIITDYCKAFDYLKVASTIDFPAVFNRIELNVSDTEYMAIRRVKDNFAELDSLFVFTKELGIDSMY